MKEDGTMSEGKLLATIHRISECSQERKSSVVLYTDECALLIDYLTATGAPTRQFGEEERAQAVAAGLQDPVYTQLQQLKKKRVVQPADVADKIVQMLDQTVTDQDALITRLLDIIQLLAKRGN
jgi:hypothetical protein